jgi:GDP-L-fucose synthase
VVQPIYSLSGRRVYVDGHGGMVGSAIVSRLARTGCNLLTSDRSIDLRDQAAVKRWFAENRPDTVVLADARVGGTAANSANPAEFLYDNLMIEAP